MKKEKTIADIMSTELATVKPGASYTDVKSIFENNDFHHLLVVDDESALVGIISPEDLWKTAYRASIITTGKVYSEKWYEHFPASQIMTKNPLTINSNATVPMASFLFRSKRFRALPVVDGMKLVGIITPLDLMEFVHKDIPKT